MFQDEVVMDQEKYPFGTEFLGDERCGQGFT
jgi:hypothetical protein